MKKLMIALLGLSLTLTTVSLVQAGQTETSKKKAPKKSHKGGKKSKKGSSTTTPPPK